MGRRVGSWWWFHQYQIGSKLPRSRRRFSDEKKQGNKKENGGAVL